MKYVLGIDLGTSGTKTVLFDQYGTAVCSALVEYPLYQPHNGWAEQKPEDWYHAAVDTIRSVLTKSGVDKKDVVSMGISGQMHGLVMLDEAGTSCARLLSGATSARRRNATRFTKLLAAIS